MLEERHARIKSKRLSATPRVPTVPHPRGKPRPRPFPAPRTARRANHAPRTLLDTDIPQALSPPILQPTKCQKVKKAVEWGKKKVDDWGERFLNAPTEEPKAVDSVLASFKKRINELYKQTKSFSLRKEKVALREFANMCTIAGPIDACSPMSFLSAVRTVVTNLLRESRQTKVKMVLDLL